MNSSLQKSIKDIKGVRPSKSLTKLNQAGIERVEDLLWVLPLRLQKAPEITRFENGRPDQLFLGIGKSTSFNSYPNRKARGKGGVQLQNVTLVVQDCFSNDFLTLKWFNTYPSQVAKIRQGDFLKFEGTLQNFKGSLQILNPKFDMIKEEDIPSKPPTEQTKTEVKIQYPTINGVDSRNFKKFIDKIPEDDWKIEEYLPSDLLQSRDLIPIGESLEILHGFSPDSLIKTKRELAKKRLIYEEFLHEQIKIHSRRNQERKPKAPTIEVTEKRLREIFKLFPYELTTDQIKSIQDICADLASSQPMMRMIQGDVGCGKTTVAATSAIISLDSGFQVALMCPTESLALQHHISLSEMLEKQGYRTELLAGSLPPKEKTRIQAELKNGNIDFVIGTHALFQDSVQFKNPGLMIIDEQHKFGVDQRLKLVNKREGTHCLTMTATPIPRSLSLTQYGDLDLSIIKSMPAGRKGIKTRIVDPENFENFLTFINTRMSMKEQIYIVVPAITENPELDIVNLEQVHARCLKYFPNHRILALHGQLKSEEKTSAYKKFTAHEVDILISTSVIEVGINVPNATVMAIMNPDRFGLSSLHQLRGRVGRGEKPGFCFLVNDKKISRDSYKRLEVMEKTNDGFLIAEEDLKNRGQGNIFGKEQSGSEEFRRVANIIEHQDILFQVREDVSKIKSNHPEIMDYLTEIVCGDQRVFATI